MNTAVIDRLLCLLDVRMHALALCEVSRGTRLKLPAMDSVLVHYVLEGEGVVIGEDGVSLRFGPDTLIFLPAGCGHEVAERGDESELVTWKEIASPLGDGMMLFADGAPDAPIVSACGTISAECEGIDLFRQLREPVVESLRGDHSVRSALKSMLRELREPRFATRPLTEALMKQCLILAVRNQADRGEITLLPLVGGRDPRLVRALSELMEDPAREHTVEDLARASGMSRSLFAERFTEAFERPPMDLLKQIRLHRAANLLRSTSLPIKMVAFAVGYSSRSYFSRAFKEAYAADPRAFRNQARNEQSHFANRAQGPQKRRNDMNMIFKGAAVAGLALSSAAGLSGCTTAIGATEPSAQMAGEMSMQSVQRMVANWPEASRMAAMDMMQKYGPPQEATASMLMWRNNGPWKWTRVSRETIPHNFPMPHPDLLEQAIDYQVPLGKYDDLARYDGSVIVERTKGQISARCDKEGANFLAINLAHDVATGRRTVEEARAYYAAAIQRFMNSNEMDPYMRGIQFQMPRQNARDPDRAVI